MVTQLGCFYGPFKDHKLKKDHYIHELCAIWTPNIFLNKEGKMVNVIKEIKRSQKHRCSYCSTKGAGLGCSVKKCEKNFHYLCALATDCILDSQKYIIYCNSHNEDNINKCLNNDENQDQNFEEYGDCVVCLSGLDEDKLLICEKCSKTIHTYCNIPIIIDIPEGDYICNNCLANEENKTNNIIVDVDMNE